MMRVAALVAVTLAAAAAVVFLATREGERHSYRVRAIFDNAGFVIPGEDVKIAGVKVGRISEVDVTPDFKAAVVLEISQPGYQDFRRDASCIVRPQNLIGERFVECTPTEPRGAGSEAPPPLRKIERGPGEGQYLLPVENTSQSVDIDLIGDISREPERERLSLILNELGTGLAGRGADLNAVVRRANPALKETDRVLAILASQNKVLEDLATNSDTVLAPLARERRHVAGAIRNSSEVAKATAERRGDLGRDIERLPAFLDELKPTMQRLGSLSDQMTPVLADLQPVAPDINTVIRRMGPFSQAATPAVESLGDAAKIGTPAMTDARPVIADLRQLANAVRPVGATAADVLESFQKTHGVERLMDYIFYQVAAVNGFDAFGHYLRAGLIVNQCSSYVVRPVQGCSANFPNASSSANATASVSKATGDDPVLAATARALARALGLDGAKKAKAKKHKHAHKKRHHAKQKTAKTRHHAKRKGDRPAPAAPAPAPDAVLPPVPVPGAPAGAAPTATAEPAPSASPTPTPTPTPEEPGDALLDYLFGKDGPR